MFFSLNNRFNFAIKYLHNVSKRNYNNIKYNNINIIITWDHSLKKRSTAI